MKRSVELPVIFLRGCVIFPKMTMSLFIGRKPTIAAVQWASMNGQSEVLVLSQKRTEVLEPRGLRDAYRMGTVCSVEGSVLMQDQTMKARLTGLRSFQIEAIFERDGVRFARGHFVSEPARGRRLAHDEKLELLELFVRAKPFSPFDEESNCLVELKKSTRQGELAEALQSHLLMGNRLKSYRGNPKIVASRAADRRANLKVKWQQKILEASTPKKLGLLREYLKMEVREAADVLTSTLR